MRLAIEWVDVDSVRAGAATRLAGRALEVSLDELGALIGADRRLERVRVDLAPPGESCRIGRVLDVIAPRAKLNKGGDFPGVVGSLAHAGTGGTRALGG